MKPYYADDVVTLYHGDCINLMASLPDASVDAVVTDPPYGIGFMGKAWDATFIDGTIARRRQYPGDPSPKAGENGGYRSAAAEAGRYDLSLRGNLAFGAWCEAWAAECLRVLKPGGHLLAFGGTRTWHRLACAVEDAGFEIRDTLAWLHGQGFPKGKGQLKPAFEPVVVGRKKGPIWLNVDGCRIGGGGQTQWARPRGMGYGGGTDNGPTERIENASGRWPTNVLLDGCAADELDQQSGYQRDGVAVRRNRPDGTDANSHGIYGSHLRDAEPDLTYGGQGGASRFFPTFRYEAKAPTDERPRVNGVAHPTVKPLDLMRWLVRLVTPPGGTVLEPFAGSGTTTEACVIEGFRCIAIEREAAYLPLIEARLSKPIQPDLFGGAA